MLWCKQVPLAWSLDQVFTVPYSQPYRNYTPIRNWGAFLKTIMLQYNGAMDSNSCDLPFKTNMFLEPRPICSILQRGHIWNVSILYLESLSTCCLLALQAARKPKIGSWYSWALHAHSHRWWWEFVIPRHNNRYMAKLVARWWGRQQVPYFVHVRDLEMLVTTFFNEYRHKSMTVWGTWG